MILLFSNNVGVLPAFSESETRAAAGSAGMGVYNRVLTDTGDANVTFRLYFVKGIPTYDEDGNQVFSEAEPYDPVYDYELVSLPQFLQIGDYTLNADGTITLPNETGVNFLESLEFEEFLEDNNIVGVYIGFDTEANREAVMVDSSVQYRNLYVPYPTEEQSDQGDLIYYYVSENNWHLYNYRDSSMKVSTFTSTKVSPIIVARTWRDRGVNRGTPGKSDFIVKKVVNGTMSDVGSPYTGAAYFELNNENSNLYLYEYYLPEYSLPAALNYYGNPISGAYDTTAEATAYEYAVVSRLTADEYHYHVYETGENTLVSLAYGDTVPFNSTAQQYQLTSIGLTALEFTIEWLDAAKPAAKGSLSDPADAADFKNYLTHNFTLRDETGATVAFSANDILLTDNEDGTWSVKITGLTEIADNNTAKVYELAPNTATDSDHLLPLVVNTNEDEQDDDASGDGYLMKANNLGVNSSETGKVYQGGEMSLLLSGRQDYTGRVEWHDTAMEADRKATATAAEIVVWRYVDYEHEPGEPDNDIDASAQVQTISVPGSQNTYEFSVAQLAWEEEHQNDNPMPERPEVYPPTLDKYDNKGQKYAYYAKEKVLIVNADGSKRYETYYVSLTQSEEYMKTGETVYNKLAATSIYSVDAKWIAAARQGGQASATFVLQRRVGDGEWAAVPGEAQKIGRNGMPVYNANGTPYMVSASTVTISDFRAESMEIKEYFPEAPDYDDNGNPYQYRVVMTNVSRTDRGNGTGAQTGTVSVDPFGVAYVPGTTTPPTAQANVTVNKDQYEASTTYSTFQDSKEVEFDFTYRLVGDIYIQIDKYWRDDDLPENQKPDHSQDSVTFQVMYRTFGSETVSTAASLDGGLTSIVLTIDDEVTHNEWIETHKYPRYDEEGREYNYFVKETGVSLNYTSPTYYTTYVLEKTLREVGGVQKEHYIYHVRNNPTGTDPWKYLGIRKEWVDDGEMEFREPIRITAQGPTLDENNQVVTNGVYGTEQNVDLSDANAWQSFINVYPGNGSDDPGYVYNPATDSVFFSENVVPNADDTMPGGNYWDINQILAAAGNPSTAEGQQAAWIYELLSQSQTLKHYVAADNNDVQYVESNNTTLLEGLAGVYQNEKHYYAVVQKYDGSTHMDGMSGEIVFRNIRIGVVNLKIHMDWNVGDELSKIKNVSVRLLANGQPIGNDGRFSFTIGEVEGSGGTTTGKSLTVLDDFFILNLPKYDATGKVIEYTVEEISLTPAEGSAITAPHFSDGYYTFNGNKCVINISQEATDYSKSVSNSNDLMIINLSNSFVNTTSFTAHKQWHDNSGKYNTRSDLYINLYRKSSAPGAAEQKIGNDYLWERNPSDTINWWTYSFSGLDLYDANGYRYTYYIKEAPLDKYRTVYDNSSENVEEALQSRTDAAYNGGIINNYLHEEVVINGDKLWQNLPTADDPSMAYPYPIATVMLYAKTMEPIPGTDPVQYTYGTEKLISAAQIYNGQNEFHFTPTSGNGLDYRELAILYLQQHEIDPSSWTEEQLEEYTASYTAWLNHSNFVVHNDDGIVTDGSSANNIQLQKYDLDGRLIKYELDEVSINGYTFRISNQKIINDYDGGRPVQFTVNKSWIYNGANQVPPKITIKLYQTFTASNGSETVFKVYSHELKESEGYTYTFAGETLREFCPNGEPFHYYISEVLDNGEGQTEELFLNGTLGGNHGLGYELLVTQDTNGDGVVDENDQSYKVESTSSLIAYTQYISNTYKPDNTNFQGKLDVNKAWNIPESLRSEYEDSTGYSFTVSRRTRGHIGSSEIFEVVIPNDLSLEAPVVKVRAMGEAGQPNYRPAQTVTLTTDEELAYFTGSFSISELVNGTEPDPDEQVTVQVMKSDNTVHIKGVAIYARDGRRYYYRVTEGYKPGFVHNTLAEQQIPVKTAANPEQDTLAVYGLVNTLDTTSLRLQKRFAAEAIDGQGGSELIPLTQEQFDQYFNVYYLRCLSFELYRKPVDAPESAWILFDTLSGAAEDPDASTLVLEDKDTRTQYRDQYYKAFTNLPKFNKEGTAYVYKLVEKMNGGEVPNTVNYVKTQYLNIDPEPVDDEDYGPIYSYSASGAPAGSGSQALNPSAWTGGGTPSITVRNIFPADLVTIEKVWQDDDNADGMRPDQLTFRLYEQVPEEGEKTIDEVLTGKESWEKDVPLPLFFFNGGVIDGLEFKLDENLDENNGWIRFGYSRVDAESDYEYMAIPADRNLKLTNQKDRINGSITLNKTFAESGWNTELQPETVYFKLYRRYYSVSNVDGEEISYIFTEYLEDPNSYVSAGAPTSVYQPAAYLDGEPVGVIPVTRDGEGNYSVTIDHLPIGEWIGSSTDATGNWFGYLYRFVECDAAGNEYIRGDAADYTEDSDTFAYKWTYTEGVTPGNDGRHLAIPYTLGANGTKIFDYTRAERTQGIQNTPKTTSFRYVKIWEDENNQYGHRAPIQVILQRRTAGGTWENVLTTGSAGYSGGAKGSQGTASSAAAADPMPDAQLPVTRGVSHSGLSGDLPVTEADDEASLRDAVAAGGSVRLTANIDLGAATLSIPADKTVTLDLNGKTLTASGIAITNYGTLTVTDSSAHPGTVRGNYAVRAKSSSTTTLENGHFEAQECAVSTAKGDHDATIHILGGIYTTVDNSVLSGNGSANSGGNTWNVSGGAFNANISSPGYIACGVYAPNSDTWNITGGSFTVNGGAGIVQRAGTVNVGGTVTIQTTGTASGWVGDKKTALPSAALVYESTTNYPQTESSGMRVTGGSFTAETGEDAIRLLKPAGESNNRFSVSGGSFSTAVPEDYCAEGFDPVPNADGSYGVVSETSVARADNVGYPTLQAALNAGGRIELLQNVTENGLTVSGTVDLDLNGHTVTATSGSALVNNGTLTLRDSVGGGKLVSERKNGIVCGADSTTTVLSGAIEAQECAACTVAGTQNATINIQGGSFTTVDNSVLSGNGSTNSGGNTWNVTGGSFNGHITSAGYSACGIYAPNNDTWNVTGGDFTVTGGSHGAVGVAQRAGTVNLGGTVTFDVSGTGAGWVGDKKTNLPTADLVFDSTTPGYPGFAASDRLNVTGGSFASDGVSAQGMDASDTHIAISGGTFDQEVPENCCAEGFQPKQNDYVEPIGYTYTVEPDTDIFDPGDSWQGVYTAAAPANADAAVTQAAELTLDQQGGLFTDLPMYDKDGNLYEYRVLEIKIGERPVFNIGGVNRTNDYFVTHQQTPGLSLITNRLIPYDLSQNYKVEKNWEDNGNQDGTRPESLTVYLIQKYVEDAENPDSEPVNRFPGVLNEQNNWRFEWDNYPAFTIDGRAVYYEVQEQTPSGYTLQYNSATDYTHNNTGDTAYEWRRFNNVHDQPNQSLTVDKTWLNEHTEADKLLRPEGITFELYCRYTLYKYVNSDDPTAALTSEAEIIAAAEAGKLQTAVDTVYDGPVSAAEELLARYGALSACLTADSSDPSVLYYRKTLTPGDRTVDALWQGKLVFPNLPVYLNNLGTSRWNGEDCAVEYYVVEIDPFEGQTAKNPYIFGVHAASDTTGDGKSDATNLVGEDPTVTAQNKLKTRTFTVTKRWNDNGYNGSNTHYDIDFTLCGAGDSNSADPSGYSYSETLKRTMQTGTNGGSVSFLYVPMYDRDGSVLSFTVSEKVAGMSTAASMYGYLQSEPVYTSTNGLQTGATITNTLPVVRLKADKLWIDNNNQDGKRPGQLDLTLTCTADGITTTVASTAGTQHSDGSANYTGENAVKEKWDAFDFGWQPVYNQNNHPYVYSVSEAASSADAASGGSLEERGYVRLTAMPGASGIAGTDSTGSAGTDSVGSSGADSVGGAVQNLPAHPGASSGSGEKTAPAELPPAERTSGGAAVSEPKPQTDTVDAPAGAASTLGVRGTTVARIGSESYDSLRAAIEAAAPGATVELLADDVVSFAAGGIVIDKSLTIVGNNHTVIGQSDVGSANVASMAEVTDDNVHGFYIKSGSVTIRNLTMTQFGDTDYLNKFGRVPILTSTDYTGTLTLSNVSFNKFNRQAICVNGGSFTITGGTINCNADGCAGALTTYDYLQQPIEIRGGSGTISGVTIRGGGSGGPGISYPGGAIVTFGGAGAVDIQNVDIDFSGNGIWDDGGVVTMGGASTVVKVNSSKPIGGGTGHALYVEDGYKLNVTDGSYTGSLAVDSNPASTICVTGGTFSENPGAYVPADLAVTGNGSGGFVIREAVAQIGSQSYASIAEAIAAVPTGTTSATQIKLLKDVTGAGPLVEVPAGKFVSLDLGGHTLTAVSGDCAYVDSAAGNKGKLILQNGNFLSTNGDGVGLYRNSEGAELEIRSDVTIHAKGISVFGWTGKNGTIQIMGGSFTSDDNAVIFLNGNEGRGGNSLVVNGGTFTGTSETAGMLACGICASNSDTVIVTGGTFNITNGVGILQRGGVAHVGGSVTINTTGTGTGRLGDSPVKLPCAALVFDSDSSYPGLDHAGASAQSSVMNVTGGSFTSASTVNPVQFVREPGDAETRFSVSGGNFSAEVDHDFLADSCMSVTYTGDRFGVQPKNGLAVGDGNNLVEILADGTQVFHFINKYEPEQDDLKVIKSWVDTVSGINFSGWTRPTSVEVKLQYSYTPAGGQKVTVDLTTAPNTDLVKAAILQANPRYAFTRTITVGENWQKVFDCLPRYINPTGTAVFNGAEYLISYSVVETPLNGYTKDDTASQSLNGTSAVDELTVTNTLKTKTVQVQKLWVDPYTGSQVQHYDVHLTLANTNAGVNYTATQTIAQSGSPTAATTTSPAVSFVVPEYIASGAAATFTVTENAGDRQYGYVTSYSSNHSFDASAIANNEMITVTNTLPVVRILADKTWNDNHNQDGKRPAQLDFTLSAASRTDTVVRYDGTANYTAASQDDVWCVDFGLQPIYNAANAAYSYQVAEAAHSGETLAQRGYGRYVTVNDASSDRAAYAILEGAAVSADDYGTVTPGTDSAGNPQRTFHFQNRRTPEQDDLKVIKSWNDTVGSVDFSGWTRPTSVEVKLQYSYTPAGGQKVTVDLTTAPNTDLVKAAILQANPRYAFTRTITVGENWQKVFDCLPRYINPTGTAVFNGAEYLISYSVVETPLNGYTKNDTASQSLNGTSAVDELTVTNTLNTKTVKVYKQWVDNYSGDLAQHYDVTFSLASTNAPSPLAQYGASGGIPVSTGYAAASPNASATPTTSTSWVEFTVPQYFTDGTNEFAALYRLIESSAQQYGYVASYTDGTAAESAGFDFNAATYDKTAITVVNTLPVVRVKADKVWDDNENQDGARPAALTYTLTLGGTSLSEQRTCTGGASSTATAASWAVDFGRYPRYQADGLTPYAYAASEAASSGAALSARGYTRYITTPGGDVPLPSDYTITLGAVYPAANAGSVEQNPVGGHPEQTETVFHFKNVYEPRTDALKIRKNWNNTLDGVDYTSLTQPDSIEVALWCEYNDNGVVRKVNLDTAEGSGSTADPVKALILAQDPDFDFSPEIVPGDAGDPWKTVFSGLPLYVNTTGTAYANGASSAITYSIVEKSVLPAYTKTDSSTDYDHIKTTLNGTEALDCLEIANTLNSKTVQVRKHWVDNLTEADLRSLVEHYNVNLTLTNDTTTWKQKVIEQSGSPTALESDSPAVTFTVPQYDKDGHVLTFTVTEDSTDRRYGYVTSYSSNHVFDAAGSQEIVDNAMIVVTNTLPLTEITVTKLWDDASNGYALRPEQVLVQLERRTVTNNGAAWSPATAGWTDCGDKAAIRGSSWTYTYPALPKFDVHNIQYEYRVTEDQVYAYDTAYERAADTFQEAPVVKQDDGSSADSALGFRVRNTLITEPLTLIKVWDDNGCTQPNLHYPVTFTVSNDDTARITFTPMDYVLSGNELTDTAELWSKTTAALPVYYKDGTPIVYTVREDTKTTPQYGFEQLGPVAATRYGVHSGLDNYYDSYTITNTLPVTTVKAVKRWAGDLELYPRDQAAVSVNLTRSVENGTEETLHSDQTITYANGFVTFRNLLVYDRYNRPYTYELTENPVVGYTSVVSPQNAAAVKNATETFTVTNTPIKGAANFLKYDGTDFDKYGADSRFALKTLPGAIFELHRVIGSDDKLITVRQNADGTYSMTGRTNVSGVDTRLTSDADGSLILTELEPNEYYLKELAAPTGYQTSNKLYRFTVALDGSGGTTVSYGENVDTLTVGLPSGLSLAQGLSNAENMSRLQLTKVDAEDHTVPLENTAYYLLRLRDFAYRDSRAEGATPAEYLAKAKLALKENGDTDGTLWVYWEKVGSENGYVTDENGRITVEGQMFGTYVFYEVKAPVGYDRDYAYTTAYVGSSSGQNGYMVLDENESNHNVIYYDLTHYEPRSQAAVKILKTNENGSPLRGAKFYLYWEHGGISTLVAEITTGYDGMNGSNLTGENADVKVYPENVDPDPTVTAISIDPATGAILLDPAVFGWNAEFCFVEDTPPTGYAASNPGEDKTRISFRLTTEVADEALHIVRANDARLKGTVELTKISSGKTNTNGVHIGISPSIIYKTGDVLPGARFELYRVGDDEHPLLLHAHVPDDSHYRLVTENDDEEALTAFAAAVHDQTVLITGSNGKLTVEGLEWGDYYLKEISAPTGFKTPGDSGNRNKVFFSVGRNNVAATQTLEMKNEPETATLELRKHIDEMYADAWGAPTFLFRITQTHYYDYTDQSYKEIADPPTWIRTITFSEGAYTADETGYMASTGTFDLEPGVYEITELRVARYTADGGAVTERSSGKVNVIPVSAEVKDKVQFRIAPEGDALVTFQNLLDNYEKQSHSDVKTNEFNGYKALRLADLDGLALTHEEGDDIYSLTIQKSALTPALIRGDGTPVSITDFSKLTVSTDETEITVVDNGTSITVSGRLEDVAGSIYTLKAGYDRKNPGSVDPPVYELNTTFELRFTPEPMHGKIERKVVFVTDADNCVYYLDAAAAEGEKNTVYTLFFLRSNEVESVLHNGVKLASGASVTAALLPDPVIDAPYSDREFLRWSYSVSGGAAQEAADDAALLAAILAVDANAEIRVTPVLRQTPKVARIGEQTYENLQTALNAGGEVVLLRDVTGTSFTVPAGKNVTLDLNGHDLTATGVAVVNRGTLTIRDSAPEPGTISGNYGVMGFSSSVLNLESGKIQAQECAVCTVAGVTGATFNIRGGELTTVDNSVLSGNGSANSGGNTWNVTGGTFNGHITTAGYIACGVYAPNNDVWNITGGIFHITNGAGVVARAGTVNLGGSVELHTTGTGLGKVGDSRVVVPHAPVVFDSAANYPALTEASVLSVSGGSFTTNEANGAAAVGTSHVAITGGTFDAPVPDNCCADGYVPLDNGDGSYTVTPGQNAARIGDRYFETLQEAVNEGGTVVLLDDVNLGSGSVRIPADKTVILDLAGCELTSSSFALRNAGTLIIDDSEGGGRIVSTNYVAIAALTDSVTTVYGGSFSSLEGAIITGGNHNATVNIHGGTFSATDNAVFAGNGNSGNGGNTWNITGGVFNGGITSAGYVACGVYAPNDDTWNITGGTFNITGGAGIVQRAGTVNIGGDVEIHTTGSAIGKVGDSRVVVPCAALVYDSRANYPALTAASRMNVHGGSYTSSVDVIQMVGDDVRFSVTGGAFSSAIPAAYCAEGYVPTAGGGTYGVTPNP